MKKLMSLLGLGLLVLVSANSAEAAQCRAELKEPRGRVLEVLPGYGYTRPAACQDAMRNCQRARMNGRHARMSRLLRCEVVQPLVTRACTARPEVFGRGLPRVFRAQATGPFGSGVKAHACQKALKKCISSVPRVRGSRIVKCVADNGATARRDGVVRPGPVTHIDPTPVPPRRIGGPRGGRH